jgi:hypothetical protein
VRLVPVRRANMRPHAWFMDAIELRAYRHTIETVNSQLEKMGIERLYARTNAGFELKVHATLIALICTNLLIYTLDSAQCVLCDILSHALTQTERRVQGLNRIYRCAHRV